MVERILDRFTVPAYQREYRVGRYRLDFAWPDAKIALETDGWWHRSPEGAAKDRERDSWLRAQGWLVFRIDDEHGESVIEYQLMRVSRCVNNDIRNGRSVTWEPVTETYIEVHRRLSPGDRH